MSSSISYDFAKNYAVAPVGYSTFHCLTCGQFFTMSQYRLMCKKPHWSGQRFMKCDNCGQENYHYNYVNMNTVLNEQAHLLVDDDAIRNIAWYHSTKRDDWYNDLFRDEKTPLVHIGSREAATDRMRVSNGAMIEGFLYRMTLKPEATINPLTLVDNNDWDEYVGDNEFLYDVNRYINSHEAPGSVSLLVNPSMLIVTGRWNIDVTYPEFTQVALMS